MSNKTFTVNSVDKMRHAWETHEHCIKLANYYDAVDRSDLGAYYRKESKNYHCKAIISTFVVLTEGFKGYFGLA